MPPVSQLGSQRVASGMKTARVYITPTRVRSFAVEQTQLTLG